MNALDLVPLTDLMRRGRGRPEVTVAVIDGPVVQDPPDLATATIRAIAGKLRGTRVRAHTSACTHGENRKLAGDVGLTAGRVFAIHTRRAKE